jgi:hypothetical protein
VAGVTIRSNAVGNVSGSAVYLHCGDNQTVNNNLLWGPGSRADFSPSFTSSSALAGSCNSGGVAPPDELISGLYSSNVLLLLGSQQQSLFNRGQLYQNLSFQLNVYWAEAPALPGQLAWPLTAAVNSSFQQWQGAGQDTGGAVADPLLQQADWQQAADFTLAQGSPALARGWRQLPSRWGPL